MGNTQEFFETAVRKDDSFSQREHIHRQILSSVSHDLKTPLAAIIGSLEICERMKATLGPERIAVLLATALQEAYRLDGFVTNILDMARLENGLVKSRREFCELEGLLRDCIIKCGYVSGKGGDVTLLMPGANIGIETDPGLLSRAVCLLIDNAVKHSAPMPVVRISAELRDGMALIRVMDNGPGVPESRLDEIFHKYSRIIRQDHQNAGTGLGLSIGRGIAGLLGGKLSAGNHPDGGAVFTLEIPAIAPRLVEVEGAGQG